MNYPRNPHNPQSSITELSTDATIQDRSAEAIESLTKLWRSAMGNAMLRLAVASMAFGPEGATAGDSLGLGVGFRELDRNM